LRLKIFLYKRVLAQTAAAAHHTLFRQYEKNEKRSNLFLDHRIKPKLRLESS